MRVAITGGTGFVGSHLARLLAASGHEVVLIARGPRRDGPAGRAVGFRRSDLTDPESLAGAFAGCGAVAHCAGINREIGRQTYETVHVGGTRTVVDAARRAGVEKLVLLSFLRARPRCGSSYHESKWAAEEMVRQSGLDYTIVKAGMVYGRGDHMLDHLSRSLLTLPLFATVGLTERPIRPLAVEDLVPVLAAALTGGRLSRETVAVTGPEALSLAEAARRVAGVLGRKVVIARAPVWVHRLLARVFEGTMKIPLVSLAQVRILAEGVIEAAPPAADPPPDLRPSRWFTAEQIRKGLPELRRFGLSDLRGCG